jgi:helix-turn-helix protein
VEGINQAGDDDPTDDTSINPAVPADRVVLNVLRGADDVVMTAEQLGRYLGISRSAVYELAAAGRIPFFTIEPANGHGRARRRFRLGPVLRAIDPTYGQEVGS